MTEKPSSVGSLSLGKKPKMPRFAEIAKEGFYTFDLAGNLVRLIPDGSNTFRMEYVDELPNDP